MADGSGWIAKSRRTIGDQTLVLGDCLAEMRSIERESIDVVVTSPPYNLDLKYNLYDDKKTELHYISWFLDVGKTIKDLMKDDGSFFLNISGSNTSPWLPFEIAVRLREYFVLQNHFSWVKSIGVGVDSTGHFKPISGRRFVHNNHEHIFHFTKTGDVQLDRLAIGLPFKDKSNIARRNHQRDLRCRGNTWFIPYSTIKSKAQKFNHPGTFPMELPLWCIFIHGRASARVLDPFVGVGTTLVAAHHAGAVGLGIEIDPSYTDIAGERLVQVIEGSIKIVLNAEETGVLLKQDPATRGQGGWQNLMLNFQDRLNKTTGELSLGDSDLDNIRRYALSRGNGGWEQRLGEIFGRHLGPKLDARST